MENTITITEKNHAAIKKLYEQAVKDKKDSFMFNEHELHVQYAKYLLEHMRNVLDKHK